MTTEIAVEEKALSIVDHAKAITVFDQASYLRAGEIFTALDLMIKEVKEKFDPICEAAFKAHKQATSTRASYLDPLEASKKKVKGLMGAWDAEQERLALERQAELEREAAKLEENERLAEAIRLEAEGNQEEASEVLDTPLPVAPVIIQKAVPKIEGMKYRTIWKFRIVDPNAIPREFLLPDMVRIGGVVRALKQDCKIKGIEVYEERV